MSREGKQSSCHEAALEKRVLLVSRVSTFCTQLKPNFTKVMGTPKYCVKSGALKNWNEN